MWRWKERCNSRHVKDSMQVGDRADSTPPTIEKIGGEDNQGMV